MTKDRWNDIISDIKEKFEILDKGTEKIEEEGGISIEFIIFNVPIGKIRLELITKPTILNKKVTYSNRIGSAQQVEYIYSDSEVRHTLNAYKFDKNTNEWKEIKEELFK